MNHYTVTLSYASYGNTTLSVDAENRVEVMRKVTERLFEMPQSKIDSIVGVEIYEHKWCRP